MEDQKYNAAGSVVAVVVTFNRLDKLKVTVERLLASAASDLTGVLVVDNASTDGTQDWLAAQQDSRLMIHRNQNNLGGAGGFETGMRLAYERFACDWILVMDDDARPHMDTMAHFHAEDRSQAQIWAAAVYHPDGRICDMNRPSVNPFWRPSVMARTLLGGGRSGFHLGPDDYDSAEYREIDGASFVGLFVSRATVARVGFPDGRLFIYGDDVLYTLGARRAGERILFDPALRFEHDFSTMTDADRRFRPLWKSYYHYRNLLMVYRLCSGPFFVLVLPAAALKWVLKLRHHSGERLTFVCYVLRALRDGVLRRVDVPHARVMGWNRNP